MSQSIPSEIHTPASILDIISYGYKRAVKIIGPVSRFSLPFILILGVGNGIFASALYAQGRVQPQVLLGSLGILPVFAVLSWYLHYCVAHYVRDVFWAEPESNLFSYLLPKRSLLGAVGVMLLSVGMIIPFAIAIVIAVFFKWAGILVATLPTVIFFTFVYMAFSLIWVAYLKEYSNGLFSAISKSISLLKGNFWRTVGLGVLNFVILCILLSPMNFLNGIIDALSKASSSGVYGFGLYNMLSAYTMLFYIIKVVLSAVTVWFSLCIGYVGALFMLNRYYADLQARAEGYDQQSSSGLAFTPKSSAANPIGLSSLRITDPDEQS